MLIHRYSLLTYPVRSRQLDDWKTNISWKNCRLFLTVLMCGIFLCRLRHTYEFMHTDVFRLVILKPSVVQYRYIFKKYFIAKCNILLCPCFKYRTTVYHKIKKKSHVNRAGRFWVYPENKHAYCFTYIKHITEYINKYRWKPILWLL